MNVTVIGAGDVGTGIAARLADTHDITVVDVDENRLDTLASTHDVHTVIGDGRALDTLDEAGVESADILVASTDRDGANVMICGAAKNTTDVRTIARVKRVDLYETWQDADGAFGIDDMLCVNRLTARDIVRSVTLPGAIAVDTFVDGVVEMAEFAIDADAPIANQRIEEADRFASLTFVGLLREEQVIVPNGDTVIEPNDRIVVIGSPASVSRFARTLGGRSTLDSDTDIIVAGGGEVGTEIVRLLADRKYRTRLVEQRRERASKVAASLPATEVIEGDTTSIDFLTDEGIGDTEVFVSTLGDDEANYLTALLAKQLGVSHTVSVVDAAEHVALFETAGIEVAARPRDIVAGEIAGLVLGRHADSVTLIENDRAEIIEVTIDEDSVLAGELLRNIADDLPDGFVVGAVVRGGTLTPPRGGTVIQTGDHVIVFLDSGIVDELAPNCNYYSETGSSLPEVETTEVAIEGDEVTRDSQDRRVDQVPLPSGFSRPWTRSPRDGPRVRRRRL